MDEEQRVRLRRGETDVVMELRGAEGLVVTQAWFAPSYGIRVRVAALDVRFTGSGTAVTFHVE